MNITTEQLFNEARTQNAYLPTAVPDSLLQQLYDLLKWGPTSANCSPARFAFVRSDAGRAKLATCMAPGNAPKVLSAPVTAVIGMDMAFFDKLPQLFPHTDARSWFAGKPELIESTAFRNSSLQGGYLILAARAVGLDAGPMSGFDTAKVDEAFFAGTQWKTNFLVNLGYGDPSGLFPRSPRLDFDEAARFE
jgi:3-hydroxypropanoate dehydrogenase